jgi:hypothetical protein
MCHGILSKAHNNVGVYSEIILLYLMKGHWRVACKDIQISIEQRSAIHGVLGTFDSFFTCL